MELNWDQMILAHSRWKTRLKQAIESQEKIDAQVAGKDDQCEMGKWIYGEGKRHASVSAYNDLNTQTCDKVPRMHPRGLECGALILACQGSRTAQPGRQILSCLVRLRKRGLGP